MLNIFEEQEVLKTTVQKDSVEGWPYVIVLLVFLFMPSCDSE
jgi:hypothetical protein